MKCSGSAGRGRREGESKGGTYSEEGERDAGSPFFDGALDSHRGTVLSHEEVGTGNREIVLRDVAVKGETFH